MIDYFKQALGFFGPIAAIPFFMGFVGAWSATSRFMLSIIGIPAVLAVLVLGAILLLVRGVVLAIANMTKTKRAVAICVSPLLFTATLLLSLPVLTAGDFLGSFTRLMVNRSHYEAIIVKAQTLRSPASFEVDNGVTYSTDTGPPIRVAFNPEGILDNWSGIIYDPTGDVMLAKGFDERTGKRQARSRVTQLFGGDLIACTHLWRDYYRCTFT